MDLGLLIIANLIMRTRLPSKSRADKTSLLTEVIRDVPYVMFALGSFLVSHSYLLKQRLTSMPFLSSYSGESSFRVRTGEVIEMFVPLAEFLVISFLSSTPCFSLRAFSELRKLFGT
jgi:hypothetical protein